MKIRITLGEQASEELLQLMELWGHESPTHSCNKAVSTVFKQLIQIPSFKENNNGNATVCKN